MLPKINKLKRTDDFKRIFKEGRLVKGELLDLKFTTNRLDLCRFGFLISLKISKKATVRNRVKRQLSEIIRSFLNQIKPGYDLVIIVKARIINENRERTIKDLKNAVKKAELTA